MTKTRRQEIPAIYLSHQGETLTFMSRSRPQQQALRLHLDVGGGKVSVEVQLQQARETEAGDFICLGLILEGGLSLESSQIPVEAQKYARSFPRTSARLRALSPSLPGFKALSIDVSQGGLRLETLDRLLPGSKIKMSLDLDIPEQVPIPLNCRVVWCQAAGKSYLVGLQFVDLEPWVPPLLESFQAWLEGTGLKPKPYSTPELEFPEPCLQAGEEESKPPAGHISQVSFSHAQVELVLAWTRGEVFRVSFDQVLVFRDNRGLEGAAFYDAVDLEESKMMTDALKVLPVSLVQSRELYHYQFLNRQDQAILELLCRRPADYQLLSDEE